MRADLPQHRRLVAHHADPFEQETMHRHQDASATPALMRLHRDYDDCRLVASIAGRSARARVTASSTAQ
ncbi:Uncharacterised protein [Mycobacterium tuberculosis]|uniref:Uncharacterized protein n=1 Tax=Mycobacterium tuberculosis TaxID=1773 RepID=A0A0U0SPP1_MYCTX|nr:Uncharacterised protein [Mycobacterium tuberculosis]COW94918.1 Uncharacterised protein [Mycobacterium tuberculosis]